jgi:hypothetical protein
MKNNVCPIPSITLIELISIFTNAVESAFNGSTSSLITIRSQDETQINKNLTINGANSWIEVTSDSHRCCIKLIVNGSFISGNTLHRENFPNNPLDNGEAGRRFVSEFTNLIHGLKQ